MPRMWKAILPLSVLAALALAAGLPVTGAVAQEAPATPAVAPADSTAAETAPAAAPAVTGLPAPAAPPPAAPAPAAVDTAAAAAAPAPATETLRRHPHRHAVSARGSLMVPVYILKENVRSINDCTSAGMGLGAGVRWYVLDGMGVTLHAVRGGLSFTSDSQRLADINGQATELDPALTSDSFLKMDGVVLGVNAHLGALVPPTSRFYPYLRLCVSRYSWSLDRDGRGSDPHVILDQALDGTDIGIGGGFGTEYKLHGSMLLEAEWTWQYVFTDLGQEADAFTPWTNTHFWDLSLGLIWTF